MKKVLSFFMLALALVPTMFLAGCNDGDSAKAVRNKTYYVTSAFENTTDITETCKNANFRISFFTENFKVEYGLETQTATYGYYLGTYSVKDNKVTLNINQYGGVFTNYSTSSSTKQKIFSSFTYSNGALRTEFVVESSVMQYRLELPAKN